MLIQTRPTAIYTNLGSTDDVPRSVAICPNRKCVAFGCRLGIELHWVNALTGGDLNRWFPLAAPSDCLYFLPQRPGIDSRKKLRLISSADGPLATQLNRSDDAPVTWTYRPISAVQGRRPNLTRLFFGSLPFPASTAPPGNCSDAYPQAGGDEVQGGFRSVDCDHFRAVPISDGSHLLFTDPSSGLLCLGTDAPLGGLTKLVRKIMFIPPSSEGEQSVPLIYSAGKALEWGLRVVAFNTDGRLVLYNVPADIFHKVQASQITTDVLGGNQGFVGPEDPRLESQADNRPPIKSSHEAAGSSQEPVSSLIRIAGAEIAHIENDVIDDLSVHSKGGGFSLWIFYRSGRAELRRIYSPCRKRMRYVGANGLLYNVHNAVIPEIKGDNQRLNESATKGKAPGHVRWMVMDGSAGHLS